MYKHLLLPTDGSPLSEDAVRRGVQFARQLGARVTGLYAMPEFEVVSYTLAMVENSKDKDTFGRQARERAEKVLSVVKTIAAQGGVECDTVAVASDLPYEAIIKTATDRGCDLILMASHGRRGIQGFLLGSETNKVLTHSTIPVLVHR